MDHPPNANPTTTPPDAGRHRSTLAERIAQQRARLEKLQARQRDAERRAARADRQAERATDLRRKVLVGAFVLDQLGGDPERALGLRMNKDTPSLADWLTRPGDRALFGLDPSAAPQPKQDWGKAEAPTTRDVGRPGDAAPM